jgi:septum site-determining protein MinD
MAARVLTITSGKGGVGKTTATANLGIALASLGNRVVCLDADIGLRNLDVVMGLENRIVYDIVDVVEGRAKLRQAMIKDKRLKDELYLIPAAQTRDKTAVSPSDMIRICDELKPLVDFILIDSPAGIERGFRNAVAPADEVLIVTNPEVSSVRDADRIIGLIEAEGKGPGKLIVNRVKSEMVKRGDMLSPEDIIDILAIKLIGLVPEDESILISTNRGLPVALHAEDSRAGTAFRNIARRLMGEDVPFMPMEEETGLFKKMFGRLKIGGDSKGEKKPAEKPVAARKAADLSADDEKDTLALLAEAERKKAASAPTQPMSPVGAPAAPPAAPVTPVSAPPAAMPPSPAAAAPSQAGTSAAVPPTAPAPTGVSSMARPAAPSPQPAPLPVTRPPVPPAAPKGEVAPAPVPVQTVRSAASEIRSAAQTPPVQPVSKTDDGTGATAEPPASAAAKDSKGGQAAEPGKPDAHAG